MDNRQARALQTKDGWSASGKLIAGIGGLVQLQANFTSGGGLGCGQYTIQFTTSGNINSPNPVFTEALITWSVEGNFLTRRVTVCNGMSITGSGQAVKVIITDNKQPIFVPQIVPWQPTTIYIATDVVTYNTTNYVSLVSGNVGNPPILNGVLNSAFWSVGPSYEYTVGCQVVPGVRANTEIAPVLYPLDGILLNGDPAFPCYLQQQSIVKSQYIYVPIPQEAGITSVLVTAISPVPIGTAEAPVSIPDGTALVLVSLGGVNVMQQYDCKTPFWYPLFSSAVGLYLQNNYATSLQEYSFSVAFGIDG